ncbi:RsfA family transcriptional regulator [Bacillaceae bacterium S4-13-58]
MVKVRQDAWSHEDDLLLAETVLRHIREGSTQLKAFDEVGDKLNRTSAACGFRWNAEVRQRYDQAIDLAKRQRKEKKREEAKIQHEQNRSTPRIPSTPVFQSKMDTSESVESSSMSLDHVIHYLSKLKKETTQSSKTQHELNKLSTQYEEAISENEKLQKQVKQLEKQLAVMQEDYQSFIQIMDRARKMVVFDDEQERPFPAFRMEKNGNLEQVAK